MSSQDEKNKALKEELKEQITDNCIEELMITKQHLDELKDTVSELQGEVNKYRDLLQRKQAEFVNYKKRVITEKENLSKYAIEKVIDELLPVADSLEKAIEMSEHNDGKGIREGVLMVEKLFKGILQKNGVKEIESVNKEFDPNYHEAMQVQESDEYDKDTVVKEWQKGYMIGDKVLRHSKVTVVKAKHNEDENNIDYNYNEDDDTDPIDEEIQGIQTNFNDENDDNS
jgi:molecular chaperone GrpE